MVATARPNAEATASAARCGTLRPSVRSAKKKPAWTAGVRATVTVTIWTQRDRRVGPPRCGVRARAAGRRAFHRKAATATANDATRAASAVRASGAAPGCARSKSAAD